MAARLTYESHDFGSNGDEQHTDCRSVDDLVVLERIKIILDINRGTFLDDAMSEERVRGDGCLDEALRA